MAKKIKFALKMKDGVNVRNLQELRENFDLNQVTAYFLDGRLETWLSDRYYDEIALSIQELNINDPDLQKKLCWILGVTYVEEKTESIEKIKIRSRKLEKLKSITDDEKILSHVDSVAFSQEELADLLDEGIDTIYLCGANFVIPERVKDKTYIGINTKLKISLEKQKLYEKNGIHLVDLVDLSSSVSQNAERQSDIKETNDDIRVVFLCEGYPGDEDENFLVSVGQEKETYNPGVSGIAYRALMKRIKTPEILRYKKAVYTGEKIFFQAEDGQGEYLAEMDIGGEHVRKLANITGDDIRFGSKSALMAKGLLERECERIFYDSALNDKVALGTNLWRYMEMRDGWYGIHYASMALVYKKLWITKLIDGEVQSQELQIDLEILDDMSSEQKLNFVGAFGEKETDYIYLFIGNGRKGYFYRYDIKTEKIQLACKIPVFYQDSCKAFCVKEDTIFYYGGESKTENSGKIMTLNMKSGRQKCFWNIEELIKCDNQDPICQFSIVGQYLYFFRGRSRNKISHAYRIKLDGSERSIIGKPLGNFELNRNWSKISGDYSKKKLVENDIREIIGFCNIERSVNGEVRG